MQDSPGPDPGRPTVVVSGAGIAGPTLSYWLSRSGYRVIVVEVAPGIRPVGQTVDLRGIGGAVVERMGLLELMRAGPRSARPNSRSCAGTSSVCCTTRPATTSSTGSSRRSPQSSIATTTRWR